MKPRSRFPRITPQELERLGPLDTSPASSSELALVLTGGGARGAYQVGLLRCLARRFPDLRVPIITGVSAGAVNAAHLASHHGTFPQAVDELTGLWCELTPERVFRADVASLFWNVARWGFRLVSGGAIPAPAARGLVDTAPLREYLYEAMASIEGEITGIDYNLRRGTLKAVAISTTSYTTGQNVVWLQGRDIELWERPNRKSIKTRIGVHHVMASAALPLMFPAVQIGDQWYGDGGIRLAAPLSPALHLGARRVLAISTRYDRSRAQADEHEVAGYPPPAQVLGVLLNSIFLDLVDQDVMRLERLNRLLERLPEHERTGLQPVRIVVMRPSQDLSKLAAQFEPRLPKAFRFMTRGLGSRETGSPDLLAMMMFQPDYLRALIELGEADAEQRLDEIVELLDIEDHAPAGTLPEGEADTEASPRAS
ncbi:MAG TPA: patatin-like phospholipase family protein [Longimicrobiales bacterium]|nr:patatin-like phospholipase family protein [Longimicrobiales bacterium]